MARGYRLRCSRDPGSNFRTGLSAPRIGRPPCRRRGTSLDAQAFHPLQVGKAGGKLQRKLYCKAKAEPAFRFYVLYDKICREDILHHAYRMARANAGAAGVDGVTFARIEKQGVEGWLAGLRKELVLKTYRPDPVRRVMIAKHGGGERPLGIPSIRDRVVQTAAKIVLEPIFEADFEDNAYGYRPARGAANAVKDVYRQLRRGYTDVVDADLSRYFDSIPHTELLKSVARRVADGAVLQPINPR